MTDITLPPSGDTPAMLAEYLSDGARLVEAFHQLPGVARAMREAAAYLREVEAAAPAKHDADEYLLDGRMGRSNVRKADDRAVQKDAARYRFAKTMEGQVLTIDVFRNRGADELDAAIDDAMEPK